MSRKRVLHFCSASLGGATQVAVDLARAQTKGDDFDALLVMWRSSGSDLARLDKLRESGLSIELVPGWGHLATFLALLRVCRRFKPDVVMAHGFPEHLVGRWAALWAGVPHMVQVEHKSREHYSRWQRWQTRWLGRRSSAIVTVSEGVKQNLLRLGLSPDITHTIPNGIDLDRFAGADSIPSPRREAGVVMSARFSGQKDHATLLKAVALLRDEHDLTPSLYLAGSGKARLQARAQTLVQRLNLADHVHFLGYQPKVAELLMRQRIFVLSTHHEGMPLALVEAMAAGCACVATLVPGVGVCWTMGAPVCWCRRKAPL